MAKVVVTFKLEKEIYSKLKDSAQKEGRGVSEILREYLTDFGVMALKMPCDKELSHQSRAGLNDFCKRLNGMAIWLSNM